MEFGLNKMLYKEVLLINIINKKCHFVLLKWNNHISLKSKIDDITKIELKCDHQIVFISDYL